MSRATIGEALSAGDRILLDTTPLISYLNQGEPVSPIAAHIIDGLARSERDRINVCHLNDHLPFS